MRCLGLFLFLLLLLLLSCSSGISLSNLFQWWRKYRGERVIDGGFTRNTPHFAEDEGVSHKRSVRNDGC